MTSIPRQCVRQLIALVALVVGGCAMGPTTHQWAVVPQGSQGTAATTPLVPATSTSTAPRPDVAQPVLRSQSPPPGEGTTAAYEFEQDAPGTAGLTRGPMRTAGEVRQVQFEGGPPLPGQGAPIVNAPGANAAFLPPGGGQPLPPPPDGGAFLDPAWPPVIAPETVVPPTQDIDVYVEETTTGRFMFGVGVNSDAGVSGQIVIDERNFDWLKWPTSLQEFSNGTAFRGQGQGFRLEAAPGTQVQRYVVTFTEPYLFDTDVSLSLSGFFFNRIYRDWDEERMGGRVGLGYRLAPDLSIAGTVRAENVNISDPRILGVQALDSVLGDNSIYSGRASLTHDTRDLPFSPTQGHYLEFAYEQAFGDFNFPRGEVDARKYFLLYERPDTSGRHTLGLSLKVGASGENTPIFENYFAGGYSSMRGFNFRGASPTENGVQVGGRFRFIGSVEYMFPLTADDMLKGVAFVDYGTVERDIEFNSENFRVAPGLGLRINVPALGPAPLAFDFAVPIVHAPGDDLQNFSFFFGVSR